MSDHRYIVNDVIYFTEEITLEFDFLIKFIYNNFVLDYMKMENENKELITGDEYDFEDSDGYKNYGEYYFSPGNKKIKYHYKINETMKDDFIDREDTHLCIEKFSRELKDYLSDKKNNYKNLKFTYDSIEFNNINKINSDPRGVRRLDWYMKYSPYKKIGIDKNNTHITFPQVIDVLYYIKSHKFEYWYELYISCDVKIISPSGIHICCSYDHGS